MMMNERWEVIAWDGCAEWDRDAFIVRYEARHKAKFFSQLPCGGPVKVDGHSLPMRILYNPRFPHVKIWDRKNKRFVGNFKCRRNGD